METPWPGASGPREVRPEADLVRDGLEDPQADDGQGRVHVRRNAAGGRRLYQSMLRLLGLPGKWGLMTWAREVGYRKKAAERGGAGEEEEEEGWRRGVLHWRPQGRERHPPEARRHVPVALCAGAASLTFQEGLKNCTRRKNRSQSYLTSWLQAVSSRFLGF
ncbi:unnamed protein product [Prorocentrum cordatum]|uniref:Uncharacterized protein n=1 Tax=Prorocentrum cordatum TaxID=2364126 RepID=A0ABN9T956_9DINO|nr:unnamed protein product [Polarella glacialis]